MGEREKKGARGRGRIEGRERGEREEGISRGMKEGGERGEGER